VRGDKMMIKVIMWLSDCGGIRWLVRKRLDARLSLEGETPGGCYLVEDMSANLLLM
jgi:hypothetical protein